MKEVFKCILVACVVASLAGCGKMDSKELSDKVKLEMQRDLVKQDDYSSLKIGEVTLVHKGGVVYEGVATGDIQGLSVSFDVRCEYDGASLLWNVTPKDHNSLTIMSHKGKQYAEKKFGENWPKVKKQVKDSYDSAVKKSEAFYDKTKESYHAAVEKSAELYGKTMDFGNLDALADKDLVFEHSRRRRMTSPIGFTKDGEIEAKRLLEILSKALE